jgi:hypothetical protein
MSVESSCLLEAERLSGLTDRNLGQEDFSPLLTHNAKNKKQDQENNQWITSDRYY